MSPLPPRRSELLDREAGRAIFGSDAAAYHQARLGYPTGLFDHLRARIPRAPRILEIGPGSGLATQGLLMLDPASYLGVESDGHFVDFLRARFSGPRVRFVNAPFPCAGLEGGADLAACAAAFHWLEPKTALTAVRRLLRPGGLWAMWWNSYLSEDHDHPFACSVMALLRQEQIPMPPSFGPDGHVSLDIPGQTALLRDAGLVDIEPRIWRRTRGLDEVAARALFESYSFIRVLPDKQRASLLDRIARLVWDEFAGTAPNVVVTSCYTAFEPA